MFIRPRPTKLKVLISPVYLLSSTESFQLFCYNTGYHNVSDKRIIRHQTSQHLGDRAFRQNGYARKYRIPLSTTAESREAARAAELSYPDKIWLITANRRKKKRCGEQSSARIRHYSPSFEQYRQFVFYTKINRRVIDGAFLSGQFGIDIRQWTKSSAFLEKQTLI